MPDRERVIYDIERCTCHVPDACRDCSKFSGVGNLKCMEDLMADALALLKEQPEIVRCKDCKHGADTIINGKYLFKTCGGVNHKPDWFCADGERRGEAEDS